MVSDVEICGWPVAIDEGLILDLERPFHVGADGSTIVAAQALDEGRIGIFMVSADA